MRFLLLSLDRWYAVHGVPRPWLVAAFLLSLVTLTSPANGSETEYERANSLRTRVANTVFRSKVKPNWLPGKTRFWYRLQVDVQEYEFVLVDANLGKRTPAFDHAKLAAALREAGEKNMHAHGLALEQLEFDEDSSHISFSHRGKAWQFELPAGPLEPSTKMLATPGRGKALAKIPRASTRTGSDTQITFVNRTEGEVELLWLSTTGKRVSYAKVAPGKRQEQHTFSGHIWLAVNTKGEAIAAFEAEDQPFTAEITDTQTPVVADAEDSQPSSRTTGTTSPDGKWCAFVKDFNLWLADTASGAEAPLSTDGCEDDKYTTQFAWSPDSRKIVAVRVEAAPQRKVTLVESSPVDQLQPKVITYDYFKPGDKLPHPRPQLFDVAAKRNISINDALFPNPFTEIEHLPIHWSPDSRHFSFSYNQRGHQVFRVIRVDAESGEARAVVNEQCATFFCYSGKEFLHWLDNMQELIWMSERDGWNHLWLYDATTGDVKNQITRGDWVVRGVDKVDELARQIFFAPAESVPVKILTMSTIAA